MTPYDLACSQSLRSKVAIACTHEESSSKEKSSIVLHDTLKSHDYTLLFHGMSIVVEHHDLLPPHVGLTQATTAEGDR